MAARAGVAREADWAVEARVAARAVVGWEVGKVAASAVAKGAEATEGVEVVADSVAAARAVVRAVARAEGGKAAEGRGPCPAEQAVARVAEARVAVQEVD